jgi:cell division protein FtsB
VVPLGSARSAAKAVASAPRPKFTGRAAILSLVLLVLAMSYASSLRAYVQQRKEIAELKSTIAERTTEIAKLEREKRRWQDPAFVEKQARSRFGYLMPGEVSYVVTGADGKPLEAGAELADPDSVVKPPVPTAWWDSAWESVKLAGNPPKPGSRVPATDIDGTQ